MFAILLLVTFAFMLLTNPAYSFFLYMIIIDISKVQVILLDIIYSTIAHKRCSLQTMESISFFMSFLDKNLEQIWRIYF